MRTSIPVAMIAFGLALAVSSTAEAYIGPGAGLSLLGALWGLVLAIGAALAFVILWPLRKMLKRRRAPADAVQAAGDGPDSVRR